MPNKPKSYKPPHAETKAQKDKARPSASERGYTSEWTKLRKQWLASNGYCQRCFETDGKIVTATLVHHIVPIQVDPSRMLDATNLKSLCGESCHQLEHANDEYYAVWKNHRKKDSP